MNKVFLFQNINIYNIFLFFNTYILNYKYYLMLNILRQLKTDISGILPLSIYISENNSNLLKIYM